MLREPQGEGVRTDSGLAEGTEVGSAYDPMLAKIVAHGPDRPTALRRLRAALARTVVLGVPTNTGFLRRLLAHPDVVSGELDTGLVEREADGLVGDEIPAEVLGAAALARQLALEPPEASVAGRWVNPFSVPSGWRIGEPATTVHRLRPPGGEPVEVRVRGRAARAQVSVAGAEPVTAALSRDTDGRLRLTWDAMAYTFHHHGDWLGRDGDSWALHPYDPVEAALRGGAAAGEDALTAPMPGTVTVVKAAAGDEVTAGQSLLVVEAMKMEHVIAAPHDGTVERVTVSAGDTVAMDELLAVVTPRPPEPSEER
jgi:acetyl-CoA/propionyl-CoA carboxylase biotin carboxyl carrier protein